MTLALPRLQRSRGRAEVAVVHADGRTRLQRLFQQGCAKAILPRIHGSVPEAVLVNTAGGVTGGDEIAWFLDSGPGAALVATTQAAERIYRSAGGAAGIRTRLALGTGARLDWLPQETILFDGARLDRRLEIDMAADARLLALETLVLGRRAMGESLATGSIADHWRVRRAGRLVHAEALHADGDLARATAGAATLAGARSLATLILAEPAATDRIDAVRALLASLEDVTAAASGKSDILIVRILSPDAQALRTALIRLLMHIRGAALPRVWSC